MRNTVLELLGSSQYEAMTIDELVEYLQIEGSEGFKQFVKLMVSLEDEGIVVRSKNDRYDLARDLGYYKGIISIHPKGFGFVEIDDMDDVYVRSEDLNGALHKDTVLVKILPTSKGDSLEGEIAQVLERGMTEFIGTYYEIKQVGYVKPDNSRYHAVVAIPKNKSKGAVKDHKVRVRIVDYLENNVVKAEVTEILGHKNDPGIDILSVVYKYDIVPEFSKEALQQAAEIPNEPDPESYKGRRDLRGETIVTIDGDDAKDLDDAVHVRMLDNGNYLLGVSIADVSYYVTEGSPLDREAFFRGTSVYLVDRVIPMIPHRLSNGICSLNPQVDRLTITCEMEISPEGDVVSHEIFPSIIKTTERMTYNHVNRILIDENPELCERYEALVPTFKLMYDLSKILREKRHDRGSIDFDLEESKIVVDEYGFPIDVVLREREIAERIIEDFMLAANETVAEHFHWMDVPFIYRVHEHPKPEKLERFYKLARALGYEIKGTKEHVHPKALQMITEAVHGKPEHAAISTMMLRSLQKARYSEESLGHFGLAAEFYTHFTSPIRRYPDLIVHRLIRRYLFDQDLSKETLDYYAATMPEIGEQTSKRERDAIDAEREVEDMKKAEYMTQFIDEEFEGVISSVTKWGMYVELPNTVEGLVHVNDLTDDYYEFDEDNLALIGRRTKTIYKIGDIVKVVVVAASKEERTIDFQLVGMSKSRQKRGFKRIDTRQTSSSKNNRSKERSKGKKRNTKDYRPVRSRKSSNSSDTTFKNPKPKRKKSKGSKSVGQDKNKR
ncbi:MAG: ribonuclease R [Turicibacter sp.]|nr:ribonuclease R [Turicibacter sp.]